MDDMEQLFSDLREQQDQMNSVGELFSDSMAESQFGSNDDLLAELEALEGTGFDAVGNVNFVSPPKDKINPSDIISLERRLDKLLVTGSE